MYQAQAVLETPTEQFAVARRQQNAAANLRRSGDKRFDILIGFADRVMSTALSLSFMCIPMQPLLLCCGQLDPRPPDALQCSAMAKTEVYSWRVAPETKAELQRAARRKNQSVSQLLDQIVREWLDKQNSKDPDAAEQKRLHDAVSKCIGVLRRGGPYCAEEARRVIRERLARKYGRSRPD